MAETAGTAGSAATLDQSLGAFPFTVPQLTGAENYDEWKNAILMVAGGMALKRYLVETIPAASRDERIDNRAQTLVYTNMTTIVQRQLKMGG
ncbi:uncharacterized protein J7T54_000027 [Emericellopsis cladophorae]|uniref:Uncharacterized protein n=1 Tax=Emericellopsis cladophorae TaxID=2686198 RepID=A0A9P9XU22_9HYPO|nr:uncharacterized protein J7T54_000027 [Emericellopsis cladophorae]KAI6777573.1 hypothetical protein J7T54_000027 [Emericellopsis cladophorae]